MSNLRKKSINQNKTIRIYAFLSAAGQNGDTHNVYIKHRKTVLSFDLWKNNYGF